MLFWGKRKKTLNTTHHIEYHIVYHDSEVKVATVIDYHISHFSQGVKSWSQTRPFLEQKEKIIHALAIQDNTSHDEVFQTVETGVVNIHCKWHSQVHSLCGTSTELSESAKPHSQKPVVSTKQSDFITICCAVRIAHIGIAFHYTAGRPLCS